LPKKQKAKSGEKNRLDLMLERNNQLSTFTIRCNES